MPLDIRKLTGSERVHETFVVGKRFEEYPRELDEWRLDTYQMALKEQEAGMNR